MLPSTRPGAIDVRRRRAVIAQRLRGEHGFLWIELMVAMVMALLVGTVVITFMVVTFHEQNNIASRAVATNQAESGLERLVRDLREAVTSVSITNPTSATTQIQFSIPTPGSDTVAELVTWNCPSASAITVGNCTRAVTPALGTTTTKTVITGVQSMAFSAVSSSNTSISVPFTAATNVASVGMTLTVRLTNYGLYGPSTVTTASPGAGNAPILLQATADLRNFA